MARTDTADQLRRIVTDLQSERQQLQQRLDEINQIFGELGIGAAEVPATAAAPARRGPGRPRKTEGAAASNGRRGARGRGRGRGPGRPRSAAAKAETEAAETGTRKRRSRRGGRGRFPISGEETVLNFVMQNPGARTAEINESWRDEGRKGKADNAIGKLVSAGRLRRIETPGERGSRYEVIG